ncbi:MAG: SRPBCC family protein [Propionibacteriales bacterium]|nr:SRPBCC family protein [Propionibacteriales bacterium]
MSAATGTIVDVFNTTPEALIEALLDFDSYPQWQRNVLGCTVLERDEEGRGKVLQLHVDGKVKQLNVVIEVVHRPDGLSCRYLRGDVKDYSATYVFEPQGARTKVTYTITVDPGFPLPGAVKKLLVSRSTKETLDYLKKRVHG